jgi:PKD repeat protein
MSLKTRINQPFASITKDSAIQGDNIVFIKGGSTIIDDVWLQFNDLRVDVQKLVNDYISQQARRIFNVKNGILNVVITLNKSNKLEVIPSISLNQTITGNVKVFSSLSGKLPLILVTLYQDGSDNLSSILPITSNDIELFKGYGNFTLRGKQGETGPQGDTGQNGIIGITGISGFSGLQGFTGLNGTVGFTGIIGVTGSEGIAGVSIPRLIYVTPVDPIADFVGVPVSGEDGIVVNFTNLSTGSWDSVLWDFGDGTFSTDANPSHGYASDGVYTVILYVYGTGNNSKKIRYDYISVSNGVYNIQDVFNAFNPDGTWVSRAIYTSTDTIQNSEIS